MHIKSIPNTRFGSETKRILDSVNPSHRERKFLVYYLRALGLSNNDIFWYIYRYNKWDDFDQTITWRQIKSLKSDRGNNPRGKPKHFTPLNKKRERRGESFTFSSFKGNSYLSNVLVTYNKDILNGANFLRFGLPKNGKEIWTKQLDGTINPLVNPVYRSIEGKGHILFVVDIDGLNLLDAYLDALTIQTYVPYRFDWVKFSGNRGFHLIKKIPTNGNGYDYDLLRYLGKWIVENLGIDIDFNMFNPKHPIRAYSLNPKSGLCSIPVDLEYDNIDDILHRAETLELSNGNMCEGMHIKKYSKEVGYG